MAELARVVLLTYEYTHDVLPTYENFNRQGWQLCSLCGHFAGRLLSGTLSRLFPPEQLLSACDSGAEDRKHILSMSVEVKICQVYT